MTGNEFVLAQQRLANRLAAIEQEASSTSTGSLSTPPGSDSYLSSLLYKLRKTIQTGHDHITRREGTRPFFRVGQLDSEQLDEELLALLKLQVADGLKYFGSHIQDDWAAEITLCLRAILFKLTVWDHDATYGASLQNLQFSDSRHKGEDFLAPSKWQKLLYGLTTVGGGYLWKRWEDLVVSRNADNESSKKFKISSKLFKILDMIHFLTAFLSFLIFLVNGRYRSILDRVLRLRLVARNNQVNRQVSFEYLNRQLVWHAFTEFLLFALPLMGVKRWRKWLTKAWRKTKSIVTSGIEENDRSKAGEFSFLPKHICAICYEEQNISTTSVTEIHNNNISSVFSSAENSITNPYESLPCGCIYCYVCIASRLELEEGDGWTCLRCGIEIKNCKPWHADVLMESKRSK